MAKVTRGGFLKKTAGGAVAIGALGALPGAVASAAVKPVRRTARARRPEAGEAFVAYVRDPAAGEITLLIGTREVTRHDPELVERLWQMR